MAFSGRGVLGHQLKSHPMRSLKTLAALPAFLAIAVYGAEIHRGLVSY